MFEKHLNDLNATVTCCNAMAAHMTKDNEEDTTLHEVLLLHLNFSLSSPFCFPGFLLWVVRGLLCRALQEPNGRTVLVTGCDTGIGHEVVAVIFIYIRS